MKDNGTSQNYQKANLKAMIHFAEHVGDGTSFFDIDHKQVARFLDTKIKSEQIDPDKKWITIWNDYLWRLKLFFRWLHNKKVKEIDGEEEVKLEDEWKTPSFLEQIIKRREKRNKKKTKAVNEFREQLFCIYLTKIDLKWWSNSVCC